MSEFPECLKPRHESQDNSGTYHGMNGQRCHRIQGHDAYSDCLFDRPPEFDPPRHEARPLKVRPLDRHTVKLPPR